MKSQSMNMIMFYIICKKPDQTSSDCDEIQSAHGIKLHTHFPASLLSNSLMQSYAVKTRSPTRSYFSM